MSSGVPTLFAAACVKKPSIVVPPKDSLNIPAPIPPRPADPIQPAQEEEEEEEYVEEVIEDDDEEYIEEIIEEAPVPPKSPTPKSPKSSSVAAVTKDVSAIHFDPDALTGKGKEKSAKVVAAEQAAQDRMEEYRRKREARMAEADRKKAERRAEFDQELLENEGIQTALRLEKTTTELDQADTKKNQDLMAKQADEAALDAIRREKHDRIDAYLEQRHAHTERVFAAEERALQAEREAKQAAKLKDKADKKAKKEEDKRKREEYEKRKAERAAAKAAAQQAS